MTIAELILEYLKVLLSGPVVFGGVAVFAVIYFKSNVVALFDAIASRMKSADVASIKLPGGGEVSFSQRKELAPGGQKTPQIPEQEVPPSEQLSIDEVRAQFRAERANAYLWEYRYLNYFLVRGTQMVLDWLDTLESPSTLSHYHNYWLYLIPKEDERRAILDALHRHHLIELKGDLILVTPKGKEYRQWRGQLPPPT